VSPWLPQPKGNVVAAGQIWQQESGPEGSRQGVDSAPLCGSNNFSFVQGDFAVTVISDGFITVPIEIVAPEASSDERARILGRTGNQSSGLVESKTNIPLIRNGDDLIIVDVGSGTSVSAPTADSPETGSPPASTRGQSPRSYSRMPTLTMCGVRWLRAVARGFPTRPTMLAPPNGISG
jgi:hypothetical protein